MSRFRSSPDRARLSAPAPRDRPRRRAEVEAARDQRPERVRGGRGLRRRQRRQARHRLGRHLVQGPRLDAAPRPRRRRGRGRTTTDFATLPIDVNGDGKTDFVTCSYFGKNVGWVENPGKAGQDWTYHEIDVPGTSEAAVAGRPDRRRHARRPAQPDQRRRLVRARRRPAARARLEEARLRHRRPPATASARATSTATAGSTCSPPRAGSRPRPTRRATTWTWHPEWNLGADRHPDPRPRRRRRRPVRPRLRHGPRLRPLLAEAGQGRRRRADLDQGATIDDSIASVHTLLWADLDGDGKADELVTGKRVYAHEIEPGDDRRLGRRLVPLRSAAEGAGPST